MNESLYSNVVYPMFQLKCIKIFVLFLFHLTVLCTITSSSGSGSNDPKEAYFNGSAYLRLFTPMPIWGHSAISFRTCRGENQLANI